MEYKVGEIFELDGKKYQVIEDDKLDCTNCCFKETICVLFPIGSCVKYQRKDRRDVCFKLIEEE